MRNTLVIARRELGSMLVSPIAYVVVGAFLLLVGFMFYYFELVPAAMYSYPPTLRYLFGNMITIMLFAAPLLTMRLLAQEKHLGTLELVLTAPVRDWELVLGKYLAALGLYFTMLLFTFIYPLIEELLGNPDWGPIWSGYLGMVLIGGVMLAIGLLASSVTENQIIAAVLGFGGVLLLWLISVPAQDASSAALATVLTNLSISEHLISFVRGTIDTRDIVYSLSMIVFCLFLATRVVEMRRWR